MSRYEQHEDTELRSLCRDMALLAQRAGSIKESIPTTPDNELSGKYADLAKLLDFLRKGTVAICKEVDRLSRLKENYYTQTAPALAKGICIEDAMGDDEFGFLSETLREYNDYLEELEWAKLTSPEQ